MKAWIVRHLLDWIERKNFDFRTVQTRIDRLKARHGLMSAVLSLDDEPGRPNDRLLDIAEATLRICRQQTLPDYADRFRGSPWANYFYQWPGEHYRVLASLCEVLGVRHAVEIGTCTGASSLAMLPVLPPEGSLVTFDVRAWDQVPGTLLRAADFKAGRFSQIVADLSEPATATANAATLQRADLIFLDAAKNGLQEQQFPDNFERIKLKPGTLLVFDDHKIGNMLAIWRRIRRPKLDFTSFGHFTGTGFVYWE